jgi:flagellar hook protein FlgE
MIDAISTALTGLSAASKKAETAAVNIATATTPENVDKVDLSEEAVNLKIADVDYKVNVATIKATEEMNDSLMHMFDEKV